MGTVCYGRWTLTSKHFLCHVHFLYAPRERLFLIYTVNCIIPCTPKRLESKLVHVSVDPIGPYYDTVYSIFVSESPNHLFWLHQQRVPVWRRLDNHPRVVQKNLHYIRIPISAL